MIFNYHTHTYRCRHAAGLDREYVENAVKAGMKVLGFSDHAPYRFPDGTDYYSGFRMRLDEVDGYVQSVRDLKKEYEKDIRILCGFELEYYPDFHAREMEYLKAYAPDYLLLGQHILGNELSGTPAQGKEDSTLTAYVSQVLEGLKTGDFLYLAHPDISGYRYSEACIEREYRRLCEGAKKLNIPLELNLLGVREKRWYPTRGFYELAAQTGNDVVLGVDAHTPEHLLHTGEEDALALVEGLPLNFLTEPWI